ncbi:MAG: hypothetical protein ACI86M_003789 [Saprospiraceae bacterium]
MWKNDDFAHLENVFRNPKLADFNQDGVPEVYSEAIVLNSITGKTLFKGEDSQGCARGYPQVTCFRESNSIAGNFTDHDGLELAAGNNIYEIDLVNLNDTIGNTASVITAPIDVKEGLTSMSDIDGDGLMEVLVSRDNFLMMVVYGFGTHGIIQY